MTCEAFRTLPSAFPFPSISHGWAEPSIVKNMELKQPGFMTGTSSSARRESNNHSTMPRRGLGFGK